jgi:O-antigen ligase
VNVVAGRIGGHETRARRGEALLTFAALSTAAALGALVVGAPFVLAGVLLGAALLGAVFLRPLLVLGVVLLIGPVDLSFVTGGFKGLFESLGGLDMNGIRLIGVSFGLGVTALAVPRTRAVLLGPWGIVYAAFLLWCLFALARAPDPVYGLRFLLKLAFPLLVFVTIVGMAESREQLDRLIDFALIGAALIALVMNPFYAAFGGYHVYDSGHLRIRGVGIHENPFSFYLLVCLYISLSRFLHRGQLRYLFLCAALGTWMVLTLTRITFLSALVGLAAMAIYGLFATRNPRVLLGAGGLGFLLALALLPVVLERSLGFVPTPGELLDLARHPMALYESINWQGREVAWPIVFAAFMTMPWIGLGLGASVMVMREYFPADAGELVHNEYLRLATEAGIIGVVLFALAILLWLVAVIRADRRTAGAAREFSIPAVAAILSWAIIAITDNAFDYYAPYTQFVALLVGASVACMRLQHQQRAGAAAASEAPG